MAELAKEKDIDEKEPKTDDKQEGKSENKKGFIGKIKEKIKKKKTAKKKKKSNGKKGGAKKSKAKNPDGKANIDWEAHNKAAKNLFELQNVNRDALIVRIRKAEGW